VRAVNLDRHRSSFLTSRRSLPLRQTRRLGVRFALVLQPAGAQPQQVTHLIVGFHLRDLLLYELVIRDASAKRFALVCISDRSVTRGAYDSSSSGRNRVTSLLERKHRDLEALALFADHVLLRHAHVLQ